MHYVNYIYATFFLNFCRFLGGLHKFAESKNASGGGDNSGFNPSDRPSPSSAAGDGFMNIPDGIDEELPFN